MSLAALVVLAGVMYSGCQAGPGSTEQPTTPEDPAIVPRAGIEWRLVRQGGGFTAPDGQSGQSLQSIAGNGTRFVAVGDNGTIAHSSDGERWTAVGDGATSAGLYGLTWNGTRFVAVGEWGTIVYSSDGVHWTSASNNPTEELIGDTNYVRGLYSTTWNGERFVAVGGEGTIAHSSDGDYWTRASDSATSAWLYGVTWNGERFVAVGESGTIVHSNDGDRWTAASYSATSRELRGVAWNGTRFVAVGAEGTTLHSSDGDHWTAASDSGTGYWLYGVTWNSERFVAVGYNGAIMHSSDGDRWTEASDSATSAWLQSVAWNGTRVSLRWVRRSCTAAMVMIGVRRMAVPVTFYWGSRALSGTAHCSWRSANGARSCTASTGTTGGRRVTVRPIAGSLTSPGTGSASWRWDGTSSYTAAMETAGRGRAIPVHRSHSEELFGAGHASWRSGTMERSFTAVMAIVGLRPMNRFLRYGSEALRGTVSELWQSERVE